MGRGLEDKFMILLFILKILNIGQGGMILTNRQDLMNGPRPMIYDGRHKDRMYKDDEFECIKAICTWDQNKQERIRNI